MSKKVFYISTSDFRNFLSEIDGKHSKLANLANVSPRTVVRIKKGYRTNSSTARDVYRASCEQQFGYMGVFDLAFVKESEN